VPDKYQLKKALQLPVHILFKHPDYAPLKLGAIHIDTKNERAENKEILINH
jgi:hypothetical protein